MTNCNKCNVKCAPVYSLSIVNEIYVCRDCAFKIMEGYYDRRPTKSEETD